MKPPGTQHTRAEMQYGKARNRVELELMIGAFWVRRAKPLSVSLCASPDAELHGQTSHGAHGTKLRTPLRCAFIGKAVCRLDPESVSLPTRDLLGLPGEPSSVTLVILSLRVLTRALAQCRPWYIPGCVS